VVLENTQVSSAGVRQLERMLPAATFVTDFKKGK